LAAPKPPRSIIPSALRGKGDVWLAGGIIALLAIILVPLPPPVLDVLLACSISLSLLLFLVTLYARKPVEFSVFPAMLLIATMYRLALNVASTRLILLSPGDSSSAGKVIEAFGQFVVGGNYIVGLVVFSILVLINFIVITKGSGRVAEVAARFTLDAMPGKQMAIDAELNAGLIDETVARARRAEISQEADFYGSMDGASKFIRGDAIAGVLITLVNIVGGVVIGVMQNGMSLSDALQTYTVLTIGDGLIGQVPALIVSLAAGLLVTRVQETKVQSLHTQLAGQLTREPRVWMLVAVALVAFAMIPGLRIPFGLMALVASAVAYQVTNAPPIEDEGDGAADTSVSSSEARPEELLRVDPLAIEVGIDVLYLVDERQGGELLQRIQRIRNQFAQDLGVVLPPVHLRDNLRLESGEYVMLLRGEEIGRGSLRARQHLALDPGSVTGKVRGIETVDPVFGLPAYWIPENQVLKAQALGYTVVDVPTVLTTHLVELLHVHAHELFDHKQLDRTLERIAQQNPRLVDDLIPEPLSRNTVLRVFRNLIKEGVSTRDVYTIFEALGDYAPRTADADVLTEFVRQRLARHITHRFTDEDGAIHYVSLGPKAEDALLRGLQTGEGGAPSLMLEPEVARRMFVEIKRITEGYHGPGQAVVLCPPLARGALRRLLERILPRVPVLSSAELLPSARLETAGVVEIAAA